MRRWLDWLDKRGGEYELLVVDDASDDGTADRVQAIAHPRLRVLRHDAPKGEGAALRTGLAALAQPLLFYTLLRPEYPPEPLGAMLEKQVPLHDEAKTMAREIDHVHLVSGYRAGVPVPAALRLLGTLWRGFCWLVVGTMPERLPGWLGWKRHLGWVWLRLVFGLRYPDAMCPYRLLRREMLPRLPIQSDSAFAHAELLAKANFLGHILAAEQARLDAVPLDRGDGAAIRRDALRVQNAPDFGPAALPEQGSGAA
ncbi:MAG: glycosyltransferase [Gemmataceae bacterium]|nr:glycosyltransferase [Gemmataceae bacterium]